jgi:hypothetical protein
MFQEETMKKTILLLAGFMLLASVAWSDELELGIGAAAQQQDPLATTQTDPSQSNSLYILRAAYGWLSFINFSLDSIVLPPSSVEKMTAKVTLDGVTGNNSVIQGIYRPGMINLVDVGIKFALFNKLVMGVQVGVNSLYIYRMNEDKDLFAGIDTNLGANIKVTTGWKFTDNLGVEIAMYSIQPNTDTAVTVLKGLVSENKDTQNTAIGNLLGNAALGALFVLYL